MRGLIWNMRGFGQRDRRRQLIEYIRGQNLDFVGLQETIRSSFEPYELDALGGASSFHWEWLPAVRRSGGILLGVKTDSFEVVGFSRGSFFLAVEVIQRNNDFRWELVVVYGPADRERSLDFLRELYAKISASP